MFSSPKSFRIALLASACLVSLSLATFWYATKRAIESPRHSTYNSAITVTIRGKACDPHDITVPAGRTQFTIVNQSSRTLEWEILDGVMVVDERENIAPGFSQTLTVKLQPGDYAITCGLLSNPRGALHVTPSMASQAESARPPLVNYIGALAEYRVYLSLAANDLDEAAEELHQAVQNQNHAQAQSAYFRAHRTYKQIELMADMFADLDSRMNARPEYFENREEDEQFHGLYRIAHQLQTSQDISALNASVEQLQSDITTLAARIADIQLRPERLAASTVRLLDRTIFLLASNTTSTPAAVDLNNLLGTYEGTSKVVTLLLPFLQGASPESHQAVSSELQSLGNALAPFMETQAKFSNTLSDAKRSHLVTVLKGLSASMSRVNTALHLE